MKNVKVKVESIAVFCMTAVLAIIILTGSDEAAAQGNRGLEDGRIAGVASVLNDYKLALAEQSEALVSIENKGVDIVGSSLDQMMVNEDADENNTEEVPETESAANVEITQEEAAESASDTGEGQKEETSETEEPQEEALPEEAAEPELTEEELEWQQYLMADVKKFLNIRAEADENSKVLGKLYKGDRALIKEVGSEWTKIASGSVVGYVKNEYCLVGTDALEYAKENCGMIATVTGKSLRIRKGQSTQSSIVKSVPKGTVLTVNMETETQEDWVAVDVGSSVYYVSADYVELSYNTGKAKSIEEEEAEAKAKAEAEAQAAAKKSQSSSATTTKTTTEKKNAVAANTDDLTLLAAIIQCEAGGQSYECQLAVGAVVLNRVRSSRYPNTIQKVIYQKGQFGPVSNGSLDRRLKNGISQTAFNAAEEALSGVDNTGGCLYFNVASCGHSGLKIGAVVFWK